MHNPSNLGTLKSNMHFLADTLKQEVMVPSIAPENQRGRPITRQWGGQELKFLYNLYYMTQEMASKLQTQKSMLLFNPFMPDGTYMYCQRAKNSNFSDFYDTWQS